MVYIKQSWIDGSLTTPITAARLDYIETGVAATAQQTWVDCTVAPYSCDPTGTVDSSAAFNTWATALGAGGGRRIGFIPNTSGSAVYKAVDVYIPSYVTIMIEGGVTFNFPSGTLSTDACVFRIHTSSRTSTAFITGVRIIGLGPYTIDLSAYTPPGGTNPRGINILNAKDFEVTNVIGKGIGGLAGNTISAGSNQVLTSPTHGRFENIQSVGVRGIGSSAIQFTGGYDLEAVGLYADGGVPCRIETDNNAGSIADNIRVRNVRLTNESTFANAAVYFEAHTNTIQNCSVTDFVTAVGTGIQCSYVPGGSVSNIRGSNGFVSGGGKAVGANIQHVSTAGTYPHCTFENIVASGCNQTQAFDVMDGITYINCHADSGTGNGFGPQNTQGGSGIPTVVATTTCRMIGCSGTKNAPYGVYADGVGRMILDGCEMHDTAARIAVSLGSELVTNTGFETNTTGWSAGTATSIARVTTQHNTGVASLQLTPSGANDAIARTALGVSGMAVTAGHPYQVSCYCLAGSGVARSFRLTLWFWDSGGTQITTAFYGTSNVVSNASTWTQAQGIVTAPVGAAWVTAVPTVVACASSADVHYIDDVSIKDAVGTATQIYGAYCGSGVTLVLAGGSDLSVNKTGRFLSVGTVQENTLTTVTS